MRSLPAAANSALRFDHGVASGDPLDDGFMLWTRVSGMADGSLPVRWLVANDPDLTQVVREGIAWTDGWLAEPEPCRKVPSTGRNLRL
jgi:phosphodiesterase/alkaline phosphatase D-like protein